MLNKKPDRRTAPTTSTCRIPPIAQLTRLLFAFFISTHTLKKNEQAAYSYISISKIKNTNRSGWGISHNVEIRVFLGAATLERTANCERSEINNSYSRKLKQTFYKTILIYFLIGSSNCWTPLCAKNCD